jgi:phage gpG-like protein
MAWWTGKDTSIYRSGGGEARNDFSVRTLRDGVQALSKQFEDLTPLMEELGRFLDAKVLVTFISQTFNGRRWPARQGSASKPSILGVVADLTEGPEVHANRFKDRPALVDTGTLRRSIRFTTSRNSVHLRSTMPYADRAEKGWHARLPITQAVRGNLATLLRGNPSLRPALGFLFRRPSVDADVPPRPFIGVQDKDKAKINEMVRDYLQDKAESAREST